MTNVKDLLSTALQQAGYGGLFNWDCGCACELSDLIPCGSLETICEPGIKKLGCCAETCGEGCSFHIVPKEGV